MKIINIKLFKIEKLALPIICRVEAFSLDDWRRWESNPYPIPFTLALSTVETIPSPYMQLIFD